MFYWFVNSVVFLFSIGLTWVISRLAWSYGFVDHPGPRRSHALSTPRGGGLAIVLAFGLWLGWGVFYLELPRILWLPLCPAFMIAAVGFMDDLCSLSALKRLLIQFSVCILSLYLMGGMHFVLNIKGIVIPNWIVLMGSCLFLVWSINLYNFMDGVNGLAGFEALSVSIFMAIITYLDGDFTRSSMWSILFSAVAGFLIWNFPKAKIFLGDVGSYFLGSMFGILLIQSANVKPRWFWCGLILLGFFVVDATMTLLVRLWFRQPVFQAHTTHAFQIFLRNFHSNHTIVTSLVLGINVLWLMPWALLVSKGYVPGLLALLIAYLPLVIIVWVVEAGKPEI